MKDMNANFSGKTALVTGAGHGIGQATAIELARHGAFVVVHYNSDEAGAHQTLAGIEAADGNGMLYKADATKAAEVQQLFAEIEAKTGRLDILVNNAGGLVQRCKIAEMSEELWDTVVNINLKSAFLCSRAAIELLKGNPGGRIINLSSLAALDGGGPGAAHYAATKGAILTFTKALAKELAPFGITVNCVAPGLIATLFHDTFSTPQGRQAIMGNTLMAREGQPADVTAAIVFLASEGASYITGETININGGLRLC
jgi:3-oxoacyl-[acyl-carrier protein] reductase